MAFFRRSKTTARRPHSRPRTFSRRLVIEALEPKMVLSASGFDDTGGGGGSIVNGTVVPQSAYPAVGIVGDSGIVFNCTGTLIGSQYVLTAAHCAEGVGPTQGRFTLNGVTYGTTHVVVHELYNPFNFSAGYDIAIFRLDQEITGVTPMPFMTESPILGETLTMVGYGNGGTTGNPVFDFPNLREGFTELESITSQHIGWHFDGNGESNTANGDSGGPAFVERNGELVIAGIVSGGSQSDWWNPGDDSFDTRVDVHAAWIQNILDGNLPEPPEDDHTDIVGSEATLITLDGNGEGSATGMIGHFGDRDIFQFQVATSAVTEISLSETAGGLDTYLRVYNASGAQIAFDDDSGPGTDSRLSVSLDAGMTYYISAGAFDDSDTGEYLVEIDASGSAGTDDHVNFPGPGATALSFDAAGHASATGEIEINSDRDVFVFSISASTTATIALNATGGGLDTYLRLYNSTDFVTPIEFDDDDGPDLNSLITRSLSAGTYYVSAAAYVGFSETTGTYLLDVNVDPAAVVIPGDYDHDHDVDGDDFLVWQSNFGSSGPDGDGDGDGDVDGDDFLIWQSNFGSGGGSAAVILTAPSRPTRVLDPSIADRALEAYYPARATEPYMAPGSNSRLQDDRVADRLEARNIERADVVGHRAAEHAWSRDQSTTARRTPLSGDAATHDALFGGAERWAARRVAPAVRATF